MSRDAVWLLGGDSQAYPGADHLGGGATCRRVRSPDFPEDPVAVDAGRFVLLRELQGDVLVVSSDGEVLATAVPPAGTRILAASLHGDDLVLLRTPPGRGTVHAELDDAGLFYSYTVAGARPRRVQFRAWDEVRALFP